MPLFDTFLILVAITRCACWDTNTSLSTLRDLSVTDLRRPLFADMESRKKRTGLLVK